MPPHGDDYHAFLLRLRRCANGDQPVWRFSLEKPGQGGQLVFSTAEELLRFLLDLMDDHGAGQSHNQASTHQD